MVYEHLHLRAAAALAVAFSLVLPACGDDGDTIIIYSDGGSAGTGGGGASGGELAGSGSGGLPRSSGGSGTVGGGSGSDGSGNGGSSSQSSGGNGSGGNAGTAGEGTGGSSGGGGSGAESGAGGSAGISGALFVEDFEDGDYDGWLLGPADSTYEVTTATAANGSTRSLAITGGTEYFAGPNYMLSGIKPSRVSWWVRVADSFGAGGEGYFVLSSSPTVAALIYVFISQTGFTFLGNPEIFHATTPAPDQWYQFEVVIDWEQETYSASIDGVVVGEADLYSEGLAFNGLWRVDIFNANASAGDVVYYDEIVMLP